MKQMRGIVRHYHNMCVEKLRKTTKSSAKIAVLFLSPLLYTTTLNGQLQFQARRRFGSHFVIYRRACHTSVLAASDAEEVPNIR